MKKKEQREEEKQLKNIFMDVVLHDHTLTKEIVLC